MESGEIHPAVELPPPLQRANDAPFFQEKRAFWGMRTELLQQYEGQYVAVYQAQVVDSDRDKVALALRVHRTYGYVPTFVHHVSRHEPVTRSSRSPHLSAQR